MLSSDLPSIRGNASRYTNTPAPSMQPTALEAHIRATRDVLSISGNCTETTRRIQRGNQGGRGRVPLHRRPPSFKAYGLDEAADGIRGGDIGVSGTVVALAR